MAAGLPTVRLTRKLSSSLVRLVYRERAVQALVGVVLLEYLLSFRHSEEIARESNCLLTPVLVQRTIRQPTA